MDLGIFEGFFKDARDGAFFHNLAHISGKNRCDVHENFITITFLDKKVLNKF